MWSRRDHRLLPHLFVSMPRGPKLPLTRRIARQAIKDTHRPM